MFFELGSNFYYFCPSESHVSALHWTTYLSALLTPTVAILGIFIAYRQWRTAQNKLKLDLFDRRFAIYDATKTLLAAIIRNGTAQDSDLYTFISNTRGARWLFNDEIANYLDKEIYKQGVDLQCLNMEIKTPTDGEKHAANAQARTELIMALFSQFETLDKKLSPFLELKH